VLTPHIARQTGAGSTTVAGEVFTRATRYLAALAFPACGYAIAVAPVAIPAVFGESYDPIVPLVGVLFPGGALAAVGLAASAALYGTGTHAGVLKVGLPLAALNVALALALIPANGALGAAWANATTQTVGFIVGSAYVARLHHARYPIVALLKTAGAAGLAFAAARLVIVAWPTVGGVIAAALVAATAYLLCLVALKAHESQDLALALDILRGITRRRATAPVSVSGDAEATG
jgi:O-antigen/teichoic acid export membrane protein